jgi:ATP-binding cassette, subfamily B, bacterial
LAEAGVLALVAETAATLVARAHRLHADLGPVDLRLQLGAALALAFALAAARLLLQLVIAWLPAVISARVQARLRHQLFDSFTRASWAIQAQDPEGHLQELMTNQTMQTTQIVIQIVTALSGSVMFVVLVLVALTLNWLVGLITLTSAIVLFFGFRPLVRFGRAAAQDSSQANLEHAIGISEAVRLAEEAQVFGAGNAQRSVVGNLIENARRAFFRYWLGASIVQNVYQSVVFVLIVIGLAGLYIAHAHDLAELGAVILILVRASGYAQQFQGGFQSLNQMLPYLDRLEEAIARYEASVPSFGDLPLPAITAIAFERVSFSYGRGRPALSTVSFAVDAGEAIGIVGPSGAGKSTLVQLLLRLRDPDDGVYRINGDAASALSRGDWQRRVAYVPQAPQILHASVAENIRFFRDLDDAAVIRAGQLAHVHDDIIDLPDGYDTVIGQRADAVSGGQRQRICLARALAGTPDMLVLDEPTSALDMASEAAVQASLADLHGAVTIFVVAHRLSILAGCDRVLVMDDGVVEDLAPLAELEGKSAYYKLTASLARRGA